MPAVVRPIIVRWRSFARTCPAGGVNLAWQRFQTHFLRLLSKLKNWEWLRSKAQKSSKFSSVYIFLSSHLSCWREVGRIRDFKFWPRYLSNKMSSKIAVDCDWKLKKSSKFGWVSLFLSFHLPADVKLAGHFFGVTFEWLILKPKNWEWLRSKAQKKLKIKE